MRKSRLYLSLSIISMIAAVGVGIGQTHCDRYRGACVVYDNPESEARSAFEARDFQSLLYHSDSLIEQGETLEGRRFRAYALRGQGDLEQAVAAYHESMHHDSGRSVPKPLMIDAYVGLADCFARMGLNERAREWIERARQDAESQLRRRNDDGASYQMACVLAVQSSIEEGEIARGLRAFAIEHLRAAIKHGFDNWDHMRADIDLDALRGEPQFQALFPDWRN